MFVRKNRRTPDFKSYAYEQRAHVPVLMRRPTGLLSAQGGQHMSQPVELRYTTGVPGNSGRRGLSEYR